LYAWLYVFFHHFTSLTLGQQRNTPDSHAAKHPLPKGNLLQTKFSNFNNLTTIKLGGTAHNDHSQNSDYTQELTILLKASSIVLQVPDGAVMMMWELLLQSSATATENF
jgi:hypothetical protein